MLIFGSVHLVQKQVVPVFNRVDVIITQGFIGGTSENYTTTLGRLYRDWETDRKSTRLNSSHSAKSRMPSSA